MKYTLFRGYLWIFNREEAVKNLFYLNLTNPFKQNVVS